MKQCSRLLRVLLLGSLQFGFCAIIGITFWWQDWQYSLPAPKPPNYPSPEADDPFLLPFRHDELRPLLIQFSQDGCPCTKVASTEYEELSEKYRSTVRFVTIDVEGDASSSEQLQSSSPAYFRDRGGRVAKRFGVYATPQVVILDHKCRLLYRGNYQQSRFCRNPETAYVRQALAALQAGLPIDTAWQTRSAYGCTFTVKE